MQKFRFAGLLLAAVAFSLATHAQCRLLNETFNSAPTLSSTNVDGTWYPDRYPPSGFTNSGNQLKISIDGTNDGAASRPSSYSSGFYNTQGRKFNQCGGCVKVAKGDLYIPSDWASKHRRSGIWGTAFDATNAPSYFPIIGFRNVDGLHPAIYYWNDLTSSWINSGVSITYDSWYNLSFRIVGSNIEYLVNNSVVGTLPSNNSSYIGNVMLQAYNFNDASLGSAYDASSSTNSYDAFWDNVITTGANGNVVSNISTGLSYCSIQGAIDDPLTVNGNIISVGAGIYTENITINKNLTINGPNMGVAGTASRATEAKLLNCNVDITASGLVILDGFEIYQTDNNNDVVLVNGSTAVEIQNNIFERYGITTGAPVRAITTASGSGVKVIQKNLFTGDISGGLFSGHKTWNSAVYINGAGTIADINNNTFENCRTAANLDDFSGAILVNGNTFDNCGTFLSFGGATPTNGQYTLGSNDFKNPADGIINLSNVNTAFRLNITSSKFNGAVFNTLSLANLFLVESRMYHRGNGGKNGLVYYVANHEYVNGSTTTIQSAVDYGAPNDIITVKAGTYNERVSVTKPLTIQGENKTTTILDGSAVVTGTGSGFTVNNGITNVTIQDFTVKNFAGSGPNISGGIYSVGGNDGLSIKNNIIKDNVGGAGVYANGPVSNVLIDGNDISGHTGGARGIVIWNGLKQNITITNNEVYNNNCCGIELQDGSATGVNISSNDVHDNADNGIGVVGLQGPTANSIASNTLLNNGRFGIEVKNPNGNGAASGAGSVVVSGNNVTRNTAIADLRDIAGIAVFRRGVLAGNVDVPNGVFVNNNTVTGYVQSSTSEGFGIVAEGMHHTISNNSLTGNDVGVQRQAGHTPYPGDGDQANLADNYFGRGNSPYSCGITETGNTFSSNGIDTRDVSYSGQGIVTNTNTSKEFCTIQSAIDDAGTTSGNTIAASAGTYNEDVTITKPVILQGAGYASSIVSGPIGGSGSTMKVATAGAIIDGFTITRDGNNTTDWNNAGLNSAGISIQSQGNTAEVRNCKITGNRSGIDINNSNGNNIHGNIIDNNHTGMILRNQTDNTTVKENFISNNRTVGILFLDASGGTNSPLQTAANSAFNDNSITGNWYGDVVDRQTGGSLPAPGTSNLKNFECNWYGAATVPTYSNSNSSEPGYASLIPTVYGGTATAPASHINILGPAYANIDALPYRVDGTDNAPATVGFQPVSTTCTGVGPVTNTNNGNSYFTIQSAINNPATLSGHTLTLSPGTYSEDVIVNKSLSILGPNAAINPCSGSRVAEAIVVPATAAIASGEIFHVAASNVTISGLTIDGDNPALTSGYTSTNGADIDAAEGVTIYENNINNLTVSNNIIKNLSYSGVTLFGASYSAPATSGHTITNNQFKDLGTYDATSGIDFWGLGVLLYNGQYAAVTNNCMDNVRTGVQTGNFHAANPGASTYQFIDNNTMTNVRRLGIFHNLHTGSPSPYTLSNNSITGTSNANETKWDGILLGSLDVNSYSTNNTINASAVSQPSRGYQVWNVSNNFPATISGGSVTGASIGVFVNNYDGYSSDAGYGSYASLSGITIAPNASGVGIRLLDNALSTHKNVQLALGTGVQVNNGADGLVVENATSTVTGVNNLVFTGQSSNYIKLVNSANDLDATATSFDGQTGASATNAQNFAIEDKITHKIDLATLGFVSVKANNDFVTTNSFATPNTTPLIGRAIDAASGGYTVNVGSGTFNENVLVNKSVTLKGTGNTTILTPNTPCTGNGINISANNSTVKDLKVTGYVYGVVVGASSVDIDNIESISNCTAGIEMSNGISYLTVQNSKINSNTSVGIRAGTGAQMNHITVDNCEVKGNNQGMFIAASSGGSNSFDNISIKNSDFSNNAQKGMYLEKLSNAVIDGITMNNSGTDVAYNNNAGIDINLKYGTYSNITIQNSAISVCGATGTATDPKAPVAVAVKARDDAPSYSGVNAATLNNVSILNNFISGPQNGLRLGEFNKINNTPTGVNIHVNDLGGAFGNKAIVNTTLANSNATCNWFGSTTPATVASKIDGSVSYVPYLSSGVDAAPGTPGFQPSVACSSCTLAATSSVSPNYPMTGQEIHTIYLGYPLSAQSEDINLNVTGGTSPLSYDWTQVNCANVSTPHYSTGASIHFAPTTADTCSYNGDNEYDYSVTVTDGGGCTATTSQKLNVVNPYTSNGNVIVCHRIVTRGSVLNQLLTVTPSQVAAHLQHGDQLGNCTPFLGKQIIAEEYPQEVAVYPNPTTGVFIVEISRITEQADIIITDLQGRLVTHKTLGAKDASTATFDLSNNAAGMYLIQVRDGDYSYNAKLILR